MDDVRCDLDFAYVFIDDISIASNSKKERGLLVHVISTHPDEAGPTVFISKSTYAQEIDIVTLATSLLYENNAKT